MSNHMQQKTTDSSILRSLIAAGSEEEALAARLELRDTLTNPSAVYHSPVLADGHPLKEDARIIVDAFESVTNGMHNPEAVGELSLIDADSPLAPWKHFTLAVQALYLGDGERSAAEMALIPQSCILSGFGPLIASIFSTLGTGELRPPASPALERLYRQLIEQPRHVSESAAQLSDALDNSLEDLFLDTALLLTKDVAAIDPAASTRFAMWSLKSASEHGFRMNPLVTAMKQAHGDAEGLRLCALSLVESDPDLSLYFWIRSLRKRIDDGATDAALVREYLEIGRQLIEEVTEFADELGLDGMYWDSLESQVVPLKQALAARFGIQLRHREGGDPVDWLVRGSSAAAPAEIAQPRRNYPPRKAVQLELFA